jgi:hypothetical protein
VPEYATRDDFRSLAARLSRIDSATAVLAVQLRELAKDIARHDREHEHQRRARQSGRRWAATAVIAAIAAIDGPVVTVLLALHR